MSSAALRPLSTAASRPDDNAPIRFPIFERSTVVIWWQSATPDLLSPPGSIGTATAVGPRLACASDRDNGTTITERHPGATLKASWETTITGLWPRCSEPDRGLRSAQKISPRVTAFASAAFGDATTPATQLRDLGPDHQGTPPPQPRTWQSPHAERPFFPRVATSRWHTGRPPWPVASLDPLPHASDGTSVPGAEDGSSARYLPCHGSCHRFMAYTIRERNF